METPYTNIDKLIHILKCNSWYYFIYYVAIKDYLLQHKPNPLIIKNVEIEELIDYTINNIICYLKNITNETELSIKNKETSKKNEYYDERIIKCYKKNIYEFIKIIKNYIDVPKDSNLRDDINHIISHLKNIIKCYKNIFNLTQEIINKEDLYKEIINLEQFRKNPLNDNIPSTDIFFIINNEFFLPNMSDKDPYLKNLRKYYREYIDRYKYN